MENLKVEDWVMYQGKKRQIAIVNRDGTVRLKSDDPNEMSYGNGTIGCFHKNWLSPVIENQTAVDWLFEQLWNSDKDKFVWHSLLEQAKEMEKQQIVKAHGNKKKRSNTTGNYEYTYTGEMYFNDNYFKK
jgi:hypothetical protein